MSGRCKVAECTDGPARGGYGWCPTHRENWKRTGTPTPGKAVEARRATAPVLMPPPTVVEPAPVVPAVQGHRCGSCGRVFPLLVDDVLCIRCDSLHYPAAVAS